MADLEDLGVVTSEWATKQSHLLQLEQKEEELRTSGALAIMTAAELVTQGTTIAPASVAGVSIGKFGRQVVRLEPAAPRKPGDGRSRDRASFPPHKLRPGAIVGLCLAADDMCARAGDHPVRGVVSRSSDIAVTITLDAGSSGETTGDPSSAGAASSGSSDSEWLHKQAAIEAVLSTGTIVRCDTLGSDVAQARLSKAIADVGAMKWGACDAVGDVLFRRLRVSREAATPKAQDSISDDAGASASASGSARGSASASADTRAGDCTADDPSAVSESGYAGEGGKGRKSLWQPQFDWKQVTTATTYAAASVSAASKTDAIAGETVVPEATVAAMRQQLYRRGLNDPQVRAVARCLASKEMHLVHGPPGTGKTTTVVEIVRQLVARGLRVLACAPSNVAVDNLAERLAEPAEPPSSSVSKEEEEEEEEAAAATTASDIVSPSGVRRACKPSLVRLGHPARVQQKLLNITLDALVEDEASTSGVEDARRSVERLYKRARRAKTGPERWEARQELKDTLKELRGRERRVVRRVVRGADVVMATLSGSASYTLWAALKDDEEDVARAKQLAEDAKAVASRTDVAAATAAAAAVAGSVPMPVVGDRKWFDVVVIDEAAQSTEAACWLAMRLGSRVVLAGDHLQLPPTVLSKEAEAAGLGITLPHRVLRTAGRAAVSLLRVQHRMCDVIGGWASRAMYDSLLLAHPSVAQRAVADLPQCQMRFRQHTSVSLPPPPVGTADAEALSHFEASPALGVVSSGWMGVDGELGPVELAEWSGCGMVLLDTAGCDGYEDDGDVSQAVREEVIAQARAAGLSERAVEAAARSAGAESRSNTGEAHLAAAAVTSLVGVGGLSGSQVVVITPYNGQVGRIRAALGAVRGSTAVQCREEWEKELATVKVSSVDAFQGQEAEVVVLSLVRSNSKGEVGFLSDSRRINVAVTRAKRLCVIIGDSDTVGRDRFLKSLLRRAERTGDATASAGGWKALLETRGKTTDADTADKTKRSRVLVPGAAVRSAAMYSDVLESMERLLDGDETALDGESSRRAVTVLPPPVSAISVITDTPEPVLQTASEAAKAMRLIQLETEAQAKSSLADQDEDEAEEDEAEEDEAEEDEGPLTLEVILRRSPVVASKPELLALSAKERVRAMKAIRADASARVEAQGGMLSGKKLADHRRAVRKAFAKQDKRKEQQAQAQAAKAAFEARAAKDKADATKGKAGASRPHGTTTPRFVSASGTVGGRRFVSASGTVGGSRVARSGAGSGTALPELEEVLLRVRAKREAEGRSGEGTESEDEEVLEAMGEETERLLRRVERGAGVLRMSGDRAVIGPLATVEGAMVAESGPAASTEAVAKSDLKGWKRTLVQRQLRERLDRGITDSSSKAGGGRGSDSSTKKKKKKKNSKKKPAKKK